LRLIISLTFGLLDIALSLFIFSNFFIEIIEVKKQQEDDKSKLFQIVLDENDF
jgi:hypothetical protein